MNTYRIDFGCYGHGIVREVTAQTRGMALQKAYRMLPELIASGALPARTTEGESDVVQIYGPRRDGSGEDILWDYMNGWLDR